MRVPGWWRNAVGGLSRTYWIIWSGMLINRAGGFAILFLSLYLTGPRGQTPTIAGIVVGAYGIGSAAGTLLGGVLADRWGRRGTLLLAHFAGAALLAGLGVTTHLVVIAVITGLVGVAQGMPGPAFVAAIIDITPENDRPRAFNLQFWAFNLGVAAAGLIAGALSQFSFTLLFFSDAATTLITALMILVWVPESLPRRPAGAAPSEQDAPARTRTGIRAALGDRIFMTFVGLTLILAILGAQNSTILPLTMRSDGLPASAYGLVMSLAGLLIVVGQLFVPSMIRGRLSGSVLAVSLLLMAIGYGAVALAGSLALYLVCATVWTMGAMLAAVANATVLADVTPPAIRARYQAVFYLTFSLASFIAPAIGGWSWQHLGGVHWLLCGVLGVVGVVGHLLASPAREHRITAGRGGQVGSPTPWRRQIRPRFPYRHGVMEAEKRSRAVSDRSRAVGVAHVSNLRSILDEQTATDLPEVRHRGATSADGSTSGTD